MTGAEIFHRPARSGPVQALFRGAATGLAALLLYVLLFIIYAITRSSLQIIGALGSADGISGTLIANALSIGIAALSVALLLSLIVAPLGGFTMLLAYALAGPLHARSRPGRAAIVGGTTAALVMLAVQGEVWSALGSFRAAFWPSSYLFWLGLPTLLFVAGIALACWRWAGATTRLDG